MRKKEYWTGGPRNWTEDGFILKAYNVECSFVEGMDDGETIYVLTPEKVMNDIISLCEAEKLMWPVFYWFAFIIGVPGNLLALVTIATLKKSPGTFYVTLLAAADLLTIICRFAEYMAPVVSTAGCKISIMMSNLTGAYANWVLVLVCFERYFTIRFPLKRNYYFTVKRAHISAVALLLALLPVYGLLLWYYEKSGEFCDVVEEFAPFHNNYWSTVLNLTYSIIPGLILTILVSLIACQIKKAQHQRKNLMITSSKETTGHKGEGEQDSVLERHIKTQTKSERSLTIMLFAAALTFLLLTYPTAILIFMTMKMRHDLFKTPLGEAGFKLAHAIVKGLNIMTHAINFVIYFFSAARFRAQVIKLIKTKWCACYQMAVSLRTTASAETEREDL